MYISCTEQGEEGGDRGGDQGARQLHHRGEDAPVLLRLQALVLQTLVLQTLFLQTRPGARLAGSFFPHTITHYLITLSPQTSAPYRS